MSSSYGDPAGDTVRSLRLPAACSAWHLQSFCLSLYGLTATFPCTSLWGAGLGQDHHLPPSRCGSSNAVATHLGRDSLFHTFITPRMRAAQSHVTSRCHFFQCLDLGNTFFLFYPPQVEMPLPMGVSVANTMACGLKRVEQALPDSKAQQKQPSQERHTQGNLFTPMAP